MRMAYLDEAGISNPVQEPWVVVAGVIIDADQQWQFIERHLRELADEYAPEAHRADFVFHATELFSGGKVFTREQWPREERWEILDELVRIPRSFGLPVVWGTVERAKLAAKFPDLSPHDLSVKAQTIAFTICAYSIELWMRTSSAPGEVAMIVVENNDNVRKHIKELHHFMRDPRNVALLHSLQHGDMVLSTIVDTVHFAEKGHSSPLQIADACAFAIKRRLMQTPENGRFYNPIKPQMVLLPKDTSI